VSPRAAPVQETVVVRAAAAGDAERMAAIYAHHVRHGAATFETEPPPAEEIERRRAGVAAHGLPWVVVACGGEVAGYAYAAPFRLRPAYRFTVEDSIYLDPAWMGRGLGRLLLARVLADCERLGCRQMIAVIGGSANAASIGLHRAAGFTDAGLLRAAGWKLGRWVDVVLMQRALGPGSGETPGAGGLAL
jgi:phosphinothricin acetyltransferase